MARTLTLVSNDGSFDSDGLIATGSIRAGIVFDRRLSATPLGLGLTSWSNRVELERLPNNGNSAAA
jgi:hypothetical protein